MIFAEEFAENVEDWWEYLWQSESERFKTAEGCEISQDLRVYLTLFVEIDPKTGDSFITGEHPFQHKPDLFKGFIVFDRKGAK